MPQSGTVLLVESNDERREQLGEALECAGYEVIGCPGPSAPDYTCVGGRRGYCPLVERADVVVLDPWLAGDEYSVGTTADTLVRVYVGSGRAVILLGSVGWLDPVIGGPVIGVGDRSAPGDVVAAVRAAPLATGFVLTNR